MCAVTVGFLSCNDFLSHTPDNRTDINSETSIAGLLVSAYPDWSYVWLTDLMTDNTTDVGLDAPYQDVTTEQIYNWEYVDDETQDTPSGYWNRAYNAISHANTALEAIDRLVADGTYAEGELDYLRGEALMARAYAHFMLVNLFAEHYDPATAEQTLAIPYVTTVEKVPNVSYTRLTVKEVYDLIEKDIQEAMPYEGTSLISDSKMNNASWHMNTKAAATFASRFYLWRGLSDDWEKVIYYADIALGDDPAAALRDWSQADGMSWDEFAAEYTRSRVAANLQLKECVSGGANDRASYYRYSMSVDLLRELIGTTTDIYPTKVPITHYFSSMALGVTTYGTYWVYKLVEHFQRNSINANYGTAYVMYPLFVAEEALFNKAEALVMENEFSQARDLMDAYFSKRIILPDDSTYSTATYGVTPERIRALYSDNTNHGEITPHYSLTDEQRMYVKCLLRLRRTEFVHEGLRWFDIKRMHIEVRHANMNAATNVLTSDDPRRVLDLPEAALASGLLVDPENVPEAEMMEAVMLLDPEPVSLCLQDDEENVAELN